MEQKYDKWIKYNSGDIYPHDDVEVNSSLEPGIYNIRFNPVSYKTFIVKNTFIHDSLIFHNSKEYEIIMEEMRSFWQMRENYEKNNYIHKRGMLLSGAPGTGKTSLINLCLKWYFEEMKGLVFVISDYTELQKYSQFHKSKLREIEPTTPIICIFEDVDGYINLNDGETILLNLLDGNNQINNVMYIATTNYPEKLTDRLSRPGRFDIKVEIKFPTRKEREIYLQGKLGEINDMKRWLDETENKSMAFVSEMVKRSKIYGDPLERILMKLDDYSNIAKSSTSFNKEERQIGFSQPTKSY